MSGSALSLEVGSFDKITLPGDIPEITTMTTPAERRLYYHIASNHSGLGEVVEIGPWLGGSTVHIAAGLRAANTGATLHVFDKFAWVVGANWAAKRGADLNRGDCFQSEFLDNLGPFRDNVRSVKSSILDMEWDAGNGGGGEVELLFLDAPKRVRDISKVLRLFAGHVIPGKTIMLWQDFLHFPSFEIPACLARLREYMEPVYVASPGTTVAFRVVRRWGDDEVSMDALSLRRWNSEEVEREWKEWNRIVPEEAYSFRFGQVMFLHDIQAVDSALQKLRQFYAEDPALTASSWKKFRATSLLTRYAPLFEELDRLIAKT